MDSETKGFFSILLGAILLIAGVSYVTYWGGLVTKPTANILESKIRETDPLVVKSQQDRCLEIIADIDRKQRAMSTMEIDAQATEKASIAALRTELIHTMGTLREDQVPETVKAFLTIDN
jgi:hypothetical protein